MGTDRENIGPRKYVHHERKCWVSTKSHHLYLKKLTIQSKNSKHL